MMNADSESIVEVEASFLRSTWMDASDLLGLDQSTGDKLRKTFPLFNFLDYVAIAFKPWTTPNNKHKAH